MPQNKVALPSEEVLPKGPLRDIAIALHELYSDAGFPSLRMIQDWIKKDDELADTVTYERIRQILRGDLSGARWSRIVAIVTALSSMAKPPRDPDREVERFLLFWKKHNGLIEVKRYTSEEAVQVVSQTMADFSQQPKSSASSADMRIGMECEKGEITLELKRALALLAPEDLISLHVDLAARGRGEAAALLECIGRLRGPRDTVEIVRRFRMRRGQGEAIVILQEAVSSWNSHDIAELILLFNKENWRLEDLIVAIAALRSVEDILEILWNVHLTEREREALVRKFAEFHDPGMVAALKEGMKGN